MRIARRSRPGPFGDAAQRRRIHARDELVLTSIDTAAGPAGRIAVTWAEQQANHEVSTLRRVYAGLDDRFGAVAQLSPHERGQPWEPALAFSAGGRVVAGWTWCTSAVAGNTACRHPHIASGRGMPLDPPAEDRALQRSRLDTGLQISDDARNVVHIFLSDAPTGLIPELNAATGTFGR